MPLNTVNKRLKTQAMENEDEKVYGLQIKKLAPIDWLAKGCNFHHMN